MGLLSRASRQVHAVRGRPSSGAGGGSGTVGVNLATPFAGLGDTLAWCPAGLDRGVQIQEVQLLDRNWGLGLLASGAGADQRLPRRRRSGFSQAVQVSSSLPAGLG